MDSIKETNPELIEALLQDPYLLLYMADALVSLALEKLTRVLGQQLTLFAGATDGLRGLHKTLQYIKAVVDDAERKQVTQESVRVWLVDLKRVAYDIDDLLEDFLDKNGSNVDYGDAANRVSHPATPCVPSPYTYLDGAVSRYKLAHDIQGIRKRLDEIAKDKDQFNTSHISSFDGETRPLVRSRTMTSSHAKEVMIGRDDDVKALKNALVNSSGYDQRPVQVIGIVGMGGSGKTALAQTIYNDAEVRDHFKDSLFWVCVSEDFNSKRVTKAIIEQVKKRSTFLSELDSLQDELVRVLSRKHFLLILDDVWNEDKDRWNILQPCLISGAPGSRILVTTRVRKVAENVTNITYIHHLKGLSYDDSWVLFRSIALDERTIEECSQLESVGREIVSKCKGVPLLIRVMGSMMSSKRLVADWQNILSSKIWSLREAENKLLPILWLSYYNLPPHLKQCFAYCSVFPKDWELGKSMLVRLWVAQGFIRPEGNRDMEDIGADYFNDLVAWSMLQEVEKDDSGEIICKMHDLLHDLAEFIAKDEIYTYVCKGGKSEQCFNSSNVVRHAFLSFTDSTVDMYCNRNNPSFLRSKNLRTLFISGAIDGKESIIDLFHEARLLRVLVFGGSMYSERIVNMPNAIGKIKHLRYLDLSYSNIVELPEVVSHLHNLQTLNLTSCHALERLPRGMSRMVNLRHLEIDGTYRLRYLPKRLGRITSLKTLSKFIANRGEGYNVDELQWLNALQGSLKIESLWHVSREDAEKAQLWNKPHLRSLTLSMGSSYVRVLMWNIILRHIGMTRARDFTTIWKDTINRGSMESAIEGMRPHANLEELILDRYEGSKLPSWLDGMPCLHKLKLSNCLELDRLPHLPSLKAFGISDLKCETLPDGGWERLLTLRKLEIAYLYGLKSLPDGLTQLQSLEDLSISFCHKLESLPKGLGQLKKLKSITIKDLNILTHLPDSLGLLESLETLEIHLCEKLESLPHSFGQLEALNYLQIWGCKVLGSLPHGFQHLSLLRKLWIKDCPLLSARCKRQGGADWSMISHIHNIYIDGQWIQQ